MERYFPLSSSFLHSIVGSLYLFSVVISMCIVHMCTQWWNSKWNVTKSKIRKFIENFSIYTDAHTHTPTFRYIVMEIDSGFWQNDSLEVQSFFSLFFCRQRCEINREMVMWTFFSHLRCVDQKNVKQHYQCQEWVWKKTSNTKWRFYIEPLGGITSFQETHFNWFSVGLSPTGSFLWTSKFFGKNSYWW